MTLLPLVVLGSFCPVQALLLFQSYDNYNAYCFYFQTFPNGRAFVMMFRFTRSLVNSVGVSIVGFSPPFPFLQFIGPLQKLRYERGSLYFSSVVINPLNHRLRDCQSYGYHSKILNYIILTRC